MSNSPSAENLLLGAGSVYFGKLLADGSYEKARHLGNCSSFSIQVEVLKKEKPALKQTLAELGQQLIAGYKVTGRIVMDEISKENVALALAGTVDNTYSQSLLSDVAHTYVASKGTVIQIGVDYTSNTSDYTNAVFGILVSWVKANGVTCQEGVDYLVYRDAGLVIIAGDSPSVTNNSSVEILFSAVATPIPQISMISDVVTAGKIMFAGNPVSGPAYMCTIKKAELAFDGGVNLIGEEFAQLTVNFTATELDSVNGFYNLIELPKVE
jgi:hypothetical protein